MELTYSESQVEWITRTYLNKFIGGEGDLEEKYEKFMQMDKNRIDEAVKIFEEILELDINTKEEVKNYLMTKALTNYYNKKLGEDQ